MENKRGFMERGGRGQFVEVSRCRVHGSTVPDELLRTKTVKGVKGIKDEGMRIEL